jgi:hypothetical protein
MSVIELTKLGRQMRMERVLYRGRNYGEVRQSSRHIVKTHPIPDIPRVKIASNENIVAVFVACLQRSLANFELRTTCIEPQFPADCCSPGWVRNAQVLPRNSLVSSSPWFGVYGKRTRAPMWLGSKNWEQYDW